jgi:hypothetical protein
MRRTSTPVFVSTSATAPLSVWHERIAVQRLGVQDELPALGPGDRDSHRHLAAKLVGHPGLALADALDFGSMQRIDLRPALPLALEADFDRQRAQRREAFAQRRVAGDLAVDVADEPF